MAEHDRSIYHHGKGKEEKCEKAWEFLMDSMQGQPVEERMHAAGSVKGACKAVMDWYQPRDDPYVGLTSRLIPFHDGFPRSLHRPSGMLAFLDRLSLHGFHRASPCLLALLCFLRHMTIDRPVALCRPPKISGHPKWGRSWAEARVSSPGPRRKLGTYSTAIVNLAALIKLGH